MMMVLGKPKRCKNVTDESNHSIYSECCNWLVLDPLGQLVDGHQHVCEISSHSC
jgi:hypothetical protein